MISDLNFSLELMRWIDDDAYYDMNKIHKL